MLNCCSIFPTFFSSTVSQGLFTKCNNTRRCELFYLVSPFRGLNGIYGRYHMLPAISNMWAI
ncbi:hypothetical protein CW304_02660 [Bacillus sp. UFRGS-B20]|nr:hypothetical protein CW304_02660 [Bacillus sp. UFRGS-B20]